MHLLIFIKREGIMFESKIAGEELKEFRSRIQTSFQYQLLIRLLLHACDIFISVNINLFHFLL